MDAQFNNANKVLEADTKELRISIIHDSVAATGTSVCIRRSPCLVRNTINGMLNSGFCEEKVLHLLLNCVRAGMNFVFGGEPGAGKTETAKFFMQFIPKESRVITIEDSLEIHYPEINAGADAVELRVKDNFSYTDAIKACLRQNPAYLVLSEARSMEVTSLLEQWSTGVNGFTTIHLDDVRKLPDRIQSMMNNVNDARRMDKREKREKADQKRKPCGKKSAAFKSGKPCKRGLYIRISFFLENAFICHWCMYCRDGSDRITVSAEMGAACHCADRHVFGTSGIYSGYL